MIELIFRCENCKLEFSENYCDSCGARLMPALRSVPAPPESHWRALMEDIAYGNHREKNKR